MESGILLAVLAILALGCAFLRRDLVREMCVMAVCTVPLAVLISRTLHESATASLYRGATIALFGAIASVLYSLFLRRTISPSVHPQKRHLAWLVVGFLVFLFCHFALGWSIVVSLALSLIINGGIVLLIRADLVWDYLFSGFGMAAFYALLIVGSRAAGLPVGTNVWFSDVLTGLTYWGLPIEEVVVAGLLGALMGPLYSALKDTAIPAYGERMESQAYLRPKKIIVAVVVTVFAGCAAVLVTLVDRSPVVRAFSPLPGTAGVGLEDKITVRFDYPVSRTGLRFQVEPEVTGSWTFDDFALGDRVARSAVFTPDRSLRPDTDYVVTVSGISNIFGTGSKTVTYTFRTQSLPGVTGVSVGEGQQGVGVCDPVLVTLDSPNNGIAEFSFRLEPPVEVQAELQSDRRSYALVPKQCLEQGMSYKLSIDRSYSMVSAADGQTVYTAAPSSLITRSFVTKPAPNLTDYGPKGRQVHVTESRISLDFSEPMAQDIQSNLLSISPPLEGKWVWEDGHRLSYLVTGKMAYATTYVVTASAGLKDARGGSLLQNTEVRFSTIGPVLVTGWYPRPNAGSVAANSPLRVTFDQEVDRASAESSFSIEPETPGNFSWSGSTLTFTPHDPLSKDTSYTVSLKAGIAAVYGQSSTAPYSLRFVTEESTTVLAIPLDHQDHALSCEVASLKMALAYRGISVGEDALLSQVGYESPVERANGVWGDPDRGFVGSVDGKQNDTGYGTHWDPVNRVARSYRETNLLSGSGVVSLAKEIAQGNPVVVWGTMGKAMPDSWNTPSGRTIATVKGEHVRLLIGFTGKADSPRTFILNDPVAGRITWTRSQMEANWSAFGGKGIAIR